MMAQEVNDVTTPQHLLQPEYPTPYGKPEVGDIVETLDKVYDYLKEVTPAKLEDKNTGKEINDFSKVDENTILSQGDFRLNSYEWGVTYAGMLLASETTGDPKYARYTFDRLNFLGRALEAFSVFETKNPGKQYALSRTQHPLALDDLLMIGPHSIQNNRMIGKAYSGPTALIMKLLNPMAIKNPKT